MLTFADRDPVIDGIALAAGATIEVELPAAFANTGTGTNTVIILQGWPQSPIAPFPYTTQVAGNRITLTLTSAFMRGSDGEGGPGPKQVHLLLEGFRKPGPGRYRVPIHIDDGAAGAFSGVGNVPIIPRARPSANIVSFASGGGPPPPFNNPVYQEVALGNAALMTRLFMWDRDSVPFGGVDLVTTGSRDHYRLVQGNRTVGHAWVDAPRGARDYSLATTGPSAPVVNPITMVPTAGLDTQFLPDPAVTGEYMITFRLNGGNVQRQFLFVN